MGNLEGSFVSKNTGHWPGLMVPWASGVPAGPLSAAKDGAGLDKALANYASSCCNSLGNLCLMGRKYDIQYCD